MGTGEAGEGAEPESLRRWPGTGSSAVWRMFNWRVNSLSQPQEQTENWAQMEADEQVGW